MAEKSLVKNSIYNVAYSVLNVLFPFVTSIYVAYILLPDYVGKVAFAQNISTYFVILAFVGIPTYGMREISKNRDDKEKISKIFSELYVINLISTTICTAIYYSIVNSVVYFAEERWLYNIFGLSIILNAFNIDWLYEGKEEYKFIAIRGVIFKVLSFIALIIFVREKSDYLIYALIICLAIAGNYLWNMLRARKFVRFSFKNLKIKQHLKPVFLLVVVNLAIELYSLIDITMLGFMCNDTIVGYYSYSIKMVRILLQVFTAIVCVVAPRMSYYYGKKDVYNFNKVINDCFNVIFMIAVPCAVGLFLVADSATVVLFGEAFAPSAISTRILCAIICVSPIGYLLGSRVLLVSNHENKLIFGVLAGALANIALNFTLIPVLQQFGAAIATVIGETLVMIIHIALSHKYMKFRPKPHNIISVIVGVVIMATVICLIKVLRLPDLIDLIVNVCAGIFVYASVMYIFRNDSAMKLLTKVFKKK